MFLVLSLSLFFSSLSFLYFWGSILLNMSAPPLSLSLFLDFSYWVSPFESFYFCFSLFYYIFLSHSVSVCLFWQHFLLLPSFLSGDRAKDKRSVHHPIRAEPRRISEEPLLRSSSHFPNEEQGAGTERIQSFHSGFYKWMCVCVFCPFCVTALSFKWERF